MLPSNVPVASKNVPTGMDAKCHFCNYNMLKSTGGQKNPVFQLHLSVGEVLVCWQNVQCIVCLPSPPGDIQKNKKSQIVATHTQHPFFCKYLGPKSFRAL